MDMENQWLCVGYSQFNQIPFEVKYQQQQHKNQKLERFSQGSFFLLYFDFALFSSLNVIRPLQALVSFYECIN